MCLHFIFLKRTKMAPCTQTAAGSYADFEQWDDVPPMTKGGTRESQCWKRDHEVPAFLILCRITKYTRHALALQAAAGPSVFICRSPVPVLSKQGNELYFIRRAEFLAHSSSSICKPINCCMLTHSSPLNTILTHSKEQSFSAWDPRKLLAFLRAQHTSWEWLTCILKVDENLPPMTARWHYIVAVCF